jgi:hypothetical protein
VLYGALAPPVGLAGVAGSSVLAASLEAGFSVSAAAPPEAPEVAGSVSFEEAPVLSLADDSPLEALSLALVVVVLVVVVDEDAAFAAAASALVSVGGVISGVLFGTASETLAPPHALSVSPHSTIAHAASATRVLTTGPCACRTWDSR